MEIGKKRVVQLRGKADKPFYLVPLGDVHLLSEACSTSTLKETITWIARRPDVLWIGMGDYADYIGYKDNRFDPTVIDKALAVADLAKIGDKSIEVVEEYFKPIAGKCLGMLYGNHEDAYQQRQTSGELHGKLCARLGVQNLGYSCFQELEFRRGKESFTYVIRAHHGAGWAASKGGKLNRLKQFAQQTTADLTLVGHLHDILMYPDIQLFPDGGRIRQRVKLAIMTGTYLRTYSHGITTYAERKGYDPAPLGSPRIPLYPFGEKTIGDVIT